MASGGSAGSQSYRPVRAIVVRPFAPLRYFEGKLTIRRPARRAGGGSRGRRLCPRLGEEHMPRTHDPRRDGCRTAWSRRMVLGALCAAGAAAVGGTDTFAATGNITLRLGLPPVYLDYDTDQLAALVRSLTRTIVSAGTNE